MRNGVLSAVVGLALTPSLALAQWSDNFDSYAVGTINGQGGWQGWDNVASAAGQVTNNFFNSAPNSQMIQGPADSVHQYSGITSGQWSYGGQVQIPSSLTTGSTYFIMLNRYANAGTDNWSAELLFNLATGVVYDDLLNVGNPSPGSGSIPIVRDAWVPVRVDFDLTANTMSEYYNNTLILSTTWKRQTLTTALNEFQAVDLFANNAGAVYYDNMFLTQIPAPGALALLGMGGLMAARRRR